MVDAEGVWKGLLKKGMRETESNFLIQVILFTALQILAFYIRFKVRGNKKQLRYFETVKIRPVKQYLASSAFILSHQDSSSQHHFVAQDRFLARASRNLCKNASGRCEI